MTFYGEDNGSTQGSHSCVSCGHRDPEKIDINLEWVKYKFKFMQCLEKNGEVQIEKTGL